MFRLLERDGLVFHERRASCPPDFKATRKSAECGIPREPHGGMKPAARKGWLEAWV
jgi:hypothetical protein